MRKLGLVLMAVAMVAVATSYAFAAGHENCPMMQTQGAEKKAEPEQGMVGMKPGAGCPMMGGGEAKSGAGCPMMGGGEAKSGAGCPMMGGGEAKPGAGCPMMMGGAGGKVGEGCPMMMNCAGPRPGPGCRMMAADRGPMCCKTRMALGMRHEGRGKPWSQGRNGCRVHGVVTL